MRPYSVVVMGASGFTGKLVAEYLASAYGSSLKWAIAGRNAAKLESVRQELSQTNKAMATLPILIADSANSDDLNALAKQTKVVLSTVGPFEKYGSQLVEACVKQGTHYCDITGESHWVADMTRKYDDEAKANKVRLVPMSGFDSIPSDLGALMMTTAMKARHNVPCSRIDVFVTKLRGGASGGTLATMINVFDRPGPEFSKLAKELGSPYELIPKAERPKVRQPSGNVPWYSSEVGKITCPWVMASTNAKVVLRSNHLLDNAYGKNFQYVEQMGLPPTFGGFFSAFSTTVGLASFVTMLSFSWTRGFIKKRVTQPGDGPTPEQQAKGKFRYAFVAKGESAGGEVPVLSGMVGMDRDPGYSGTARMIAETALCLAMDDDKLPQRYGFLTPASSGGFTLMDRLKKAGMIFEVSAPPDGEAPSSHL